MSGKRALLVWGGWEGHTPEQSADIVKAMLETHDYDVSKESSTKAFADPKLADFDLIVPVVTMSTIEKEELGKSNRNHQRRHRLSRISRHHVRFVS